MYIWYHQPINILDLIWPIFIQQKLGYLSCCCTIACDWYFGGCICMKSVHVFPAKVFFCKWIPFLVSGQVFACLKTLVVAAKSFVAVKSNASAYQVPMSFFPHYPFIVKSTQDTTLVGSSITSNFDVSCQNVSQIRGSRSLGSLF